MPELDVTALIERFGSLGLIGWLVIWATTAAWPKICAHLDAVGTSSTASATSSTNCTGSSAKPARG